MVTRIVSIMNLDFGDIAFLFLIALIIAGNLIKFFCYYILLLRSLSKRPEENVRLASVNKLRLLFAKDWFENEEFEYRRIQAREALETTIGFLIGFAVAFYLFASHPR